MDRLKADLVEQLMCYHSAKLSDEQLAASSVLAAVLRVVDRFGDATTWDGRTLSIARWGHPLVRMIAGTLAVDKVQRSGDRTYSAAI